MRINVYSQELTSEVMLVAKEGTDSAGNDATFTGVRMMLASAETLHHTPDDDDRSAITLWLPKSSDRRQTLANALYEMSQLVESTI